MAVANSSRREHGNISGLAPHSRANYSITLSLAAQVSGILTICFVLMRLWRLSAASLDGDEIFSLLLARNDWHDLMAGAAKDAMHPPLFYILLKVWLSIGGESLFWLRLFPAVFSVLCLVPFFSLCRILNLRPIARNLALGAATVHPYAVFYAQHLRMYCVFMLGGLVSAWCFEIYLKQPSRARLIALAVVNLLLVYTHYYGWMIIGLEFLFLVWQRRCWRPMAVAILLTAILFSPWGWVTSQVLRAGGLEEKLSWVSKPVLVDLTWFFVDLTGSASFLKFSMEMSLTILAVFAISLLAHRRRPEIGIDWLTVLALAPAPLAFAASQWLPLWGHRHLIFTLWPFLMVLADCFCRLPKVAVVSIIVATGFWAAFAVGSHRNDDRKLPWDTLTIALLDQEHSKLAHIPLYSVERNLHFPLWFYMNCLKTGQLGPFGTHLGSRRDIPMLAEKSARFEISTVKSLDAVRSQYFWVAYSNLNWKEGLRPEQTLNHRGCRTGDVITARDHFHSVVLVPVQCPQP